MKRALPYLFLLAVLLLTAFYRNADEAAEVTVFLIGDSTMADKPGTPEANPERGWGQMLGKFFNDKVTVRNHAVNGRSSKSFIEEGRWATVLEALSPGDYVFIQFGHNDGKQEDPVRYANPYSAYRRNLEKYVHETRERGAFPVLLSSIVRRKFNEQGALLDTHGAYPFVTWSVARALAVPFIDLQVMTEDLVAELGPERSKEVYLWLAPGQYERFPDGEQDDTHLSPAGARAFARLAAQGIRTLDLPLARYLSSEALDQKE